MLAGRSGERRGGSDLGTICNDGRQLQSAEAMAGRLGRLEMGVGVGGVDEVSGRRRLWQVEDGEQLWPMRLVAGLAVSL